MVPPPIERTCSLTAHGDLMVVIDHDQARKYWRQLHCQGIDHHRRKDGQHSVTSKNKQQHYNIYRSMTSSEVRAILATGAGMNC